MVRINRIKITPIFLCPYCGNFTPKYHHRQKFCDKRIRNCAKRHRQDYKNQWQKENYRSKPKLGTSEIKEHRNDSFGKELQIVANEKARISSIDRKRYNDKIKEIKANEERW